MMTRRLFVLACAALMSSAALVAQSKSGKAAPVDPITGTWTTELARDGDTAGRTVTLALKYDGKKAVSGTLSGMPNPGDVKAGSFDPKTGALALRLGKTGEEEVLIILEGTLANGVVTGRMQGEMGGGTFKMVKKP
jgi:hypothetical protein